jgi:cholesterol transport system auxiliary component
MVPQSRMSAVTGPVFALTLALALAGCISFGKDPPPTLFNLTPARVAAAGTGATGTAAQAISVLEPQASARLDVLRVPVQVDDASVAYLQDAQWVEKPARLFTRLLEESIRAKGTRLVVDGSDAEYAAQTKLSGQLLDLGYDARSGSVVVRYNAVLQLPDGQIRTRLFESTMPGVPATAGAVRPALNQAANDVAGQVADWVG